MTLEEAEKRLATKDALIVALSRQIEVLTREVNTLKSTVEDARMESYQEGYDHALHDFERGMV